MQHNNNSSPANAMKNIVTLGAMLCLLGLSAQVQASIYETQYDYSRYAGEGVVVKTDPNNKNLEYHYDEMENLSKLVLASHAPVQEFQFNYHTTNQLSGIVRKDGTDIVHSKTFHYDILDRLESIDEYGQTGLLQFKHDHRDRIIWIDYPAGQGAVCYEYDGDNRITAVGRIPAGQTAANCNASNVLRTVYSYHPSTGQIERIDYPNGTNTVWSYYPSTNQVESVGHYKGIGLIYKDTFTYSPNSHQYQSITRDKPGSSETTQYGFDAYDRLETISEDSGKTITYQYDDFGNRTDKIIQHGATNQHYRYNYHPNSNRLYLITLAQNNTTTTVETLYYDDAGRITSRTHKDKGTTIYGYDDRGLLTQVTLNKDTTQESSIGYTYDAFGVRKRKTVTQGATSTTTHYVSAQLFGFPRVLLEYSDNAGSLGDVQASYVYGGSRQLMESNGTQDLYKLHDGIVGSVTHALDGNGVVKNEYGYDAFGNQSQITTTQGLQHYGYTGEEYGIDSGLVYLRARYYDPGLGRFISADPYWGRLEEPVTQNRYIYVHNNPLMFVDPSGLEREWGRVISSGWGMAANGIGVVAGGLLIGFPEPASSALGGALVVKTGYGFFANYNNLEAAWNGEEPVSKGSLFNDVADAVAPGNEEAQLLATAGDLVFDLGVGAGSRALVNKALNRPRAYEIQAAHISNPTDLGASVKMFQLSDATRAVWSSGVEVNSRIFGAELDIAALLKDIDYCPVPRQ